MRRPLKHDYKEGHSVELLESGEPFFAANIKAIDEARNYIHFQTYIVDEDETGQRLIDALVLAAERGVRVYLLLDALGTKYLSGELSTKLRVPAYCSGFSPRCSLQKDSSSACACITRFCLSTASMQLSAD